MATIPPKVTERIVLGIKRFQQVLAAAKARDVGESDTVTNIDEKQAADPEVVASAKTKASQS